jgi:hypothetical protein
MTIDLVLNRDTGEPHPVDAKALACHTAILAQSGAGKSFLVGRLVEEILVKTKARVVILDVNSDFVRLPEVDESIWDDPNVNKWLYPGETLDVFVSQWNQVRPLVLTNRNLPNAQSLRISWGGLSDAERANVVGIDPTAQPELYWSLVLVGEVAQARWDDSVEATYDFQHFRGVADEFCDFLLGSSDAQRDIAEQPLAESLRSGGSGLAMRFRALVYSLADFDIWRSVGEEEQDIAFVVSVGDDTPSATVVDLLSVETQAERLALTTRVLATLWRSAREAYGASLRDIDEPDRRVPTFLVVDEAHNIVPTRRESPAAEQLASDVIRIAAEGRKFGLFLVVVTQRPRKLDTNVLSECDALMLMRMTNASDVAGAAEAFGGIDDRIAEMSRGLKVGDLFLQGRLGGASTIWHAAPRRTRQGGKSVDDAYWTELHSQDDTDGAQ